jgi:phosphate transport system permease protein
MSSATFEKRESPDPFDGINLGDLERSLLKPRNLFGAFLTTLMVLLTIVAISPLFSVLVTVIVRGGAEISLALFTQLPPVPYESGGGIGNAIVGTLIMVGLASLISVPVGILAAIFLAEVGPETMLAQFVRFSAKVLTGFPSVLAGVFAYGAVVLLTGGFSAVAGAIALSILMIPMVLLTAEEAIRMVPAKMREAAIGMGCTQTQVVRQILLPTAFPGILTGVMLAVARAAGETAPLLFTALFSGNWISTTAALPTLIAVGIFAALAIIKLAYPWEGLLRMLLNLAMLAAAGAGCYLLLTHWKLMHPTASLAALIYNFASVPYENQVRLAWAAALVLVLVVLITNLIAQALSPRQQRR